MISKKIKHISPSVTLAISAKAKSLKKQGVDVINFAAGEPDFDTPDYIKQAAIEAIKGGFTKYTPATGMQELKEAICEKFRRDNALVYAPDQIAVSCGAKHSLYNLLQVLCEEGDEVIIPSPYWLSYPEMIKLAGARPVIAKTDKKTFTIKVEEFRRCITKKTRAIIINSPSNPTGAVYSKDTLEKIAELAVSRNIPVISDEIYEKLIYDKLNHISIASLNKKIYELTFVVNGVSKSYAMTGWRIGYLAGRPEVVKGVAVLQSHSTSNPSSISQAAALTAIGSDDTSTRKMSEEFEKRRDVLMEGLKNIKGIECAKPQGAFYCFADVSGTGMDGLTFSKKLLDEKHIAIIPGEPFGLKDHVRLSFATSIDDIKKGIERLGEWVEQ